MAQKTWAATNMHNTNYEQRNKHALSYRIQNNFQNSKLQENNQLKWRIKEREANLVGRGRIRERSGIQSDSLTISAKELSNSVAGESETACSHVLLYRKTKTRSTSRFQGIRGFGLEWSSLVVTRRFGMRKEEVPAPESAIASAQSIHAGKRERLPNMWRQRKLFNRQRWRRVRLLCCAAATHVFFVY